MTRPGPRVDPSIGVLERKTVLLDELAIRQLAVLGDGNLSAGIRRAARVAYAQYQRATPYRASPQSADPGAPAAASAQPSVPDAPRA